MVKEERDRCLLNQVLCNAANEKFSDTFSAVGSHHQHVNVAFSNVGFNDLKNLVQRPEFVR